MKRLLVVTTLIVTLIGSVGPCFGEELKIWLKASDWLKAARLPYSEIHNDSSFSLLTDLEQVQLIAAVYYVNGYRQGILVGGVLGMKYGANASKVNAFTTDCTFVSGTAGDAYDVVRNYLIGNPDMRKEHPIVAFTEAFREACGIPK